ncbi:hypothetical protein [Pedobacter agri]|nr:hypothetical protein [Pedobacter agri]
MKQLKSLMYSILVLLIRQLQKLLDNEIRFLNNLAVKCDYKKE